MSPRRRPLHTFGVSMIRIAQSAHGISQDLIKPLGSNSTMKKIVHIASFATPFVQALLYFWLVFLSFVDDRIILASQEIIQMFFPQSRRVFDKIDDIVRLIETLPKEFDYAVKSFPNTIRRFPFLDWALTRVISMLKILITTLTSWGSETTREKEITVDINCNSYDKEPECSVINNKAGNDEDFLPVSTLLDEAENPIKLEGDIFSESMSSCVVDEQDDMKINSYEEAIEAEDNESQDEVVSSEEADEETTIEPENDSIMEMFESGWLMRR